MLVMILVGFYKKSRSDLKHRRLVGLALVVEGQNVSAKDMLNVQKLHILAKNEPLANHHKQLLFDHKTTLADFYKKSSKKGDPLRSRLSR